MTQPAPAPAPPTATRRLELPDEGATAAFATRLAAALGPGTVIWLAGELGLEAEDHTHRRVLAVLTRLRNT